jgi:hypothetical protein
MILGGGGGGGGGGKGREITQSLYTHMNKIKIKKKEIKKMILKL